MAVYTKLDREEVLKLLSEYDLGDWVLDDFEPIAEGVSNTNYLVRMKKKDTDADLSI